MENMQGKLRIRIDYSLVESLAIKRGYSLDVDTVIEISKLMSTIISVQLLKNKGVLGIDWAFDSAYRELFGMDLEQPN